MSIFSRRSSDSHDGYIMNHQIALPIPYNHEDSHELNASGSGSFHFPHQSFGSYPPQFSSSYTQPSVPSNIHQPSGHSLSSTVDHATIPHQSAQYLSQSRYLHSPRYIPLREAISEIEIESQESRNEGTMLSEPVVPALEGFPNVREFDQLMKSYVDDLSVKKQDKALIHAKRAQNIKTVLIDPKATAVESAQFRFWVKKMFKLQTSGAGSSNCVKMICHEGKPVAVREKLFKILTKAHQQCQHGGRDKTSAQVRQIYSWVPKELISRFVKICPTCQVRRGGSRLTPPNSRRSSPRLEIMSPAKLPSPPMSRRESTLGGHVPLERSQVEYSNQFSGHDNWVDNQQNSLGRPSLGPAPLRAFSGGSMNNLPNSIPTSLDPFHVCDMAQVNYGSAYPSPIHGMPSHRDF